VENGFGEWCERVAFVSDRSIFGGSGFTLGPGTTIDPNGVVNKGGVIQNVPPDLGVDDVPGDVSIQPFDVVRNSFWPKSAVAWLVLSAVLIAATVQLVSPTRRWRPGLPRVLTRRGSA
jgi:hypothetical protein